MTRCTCCFILIFLAASSWASTGSIPDCPYCWAYEGGSKLLDVEPVYSSTNPDEVTPGSRFQPCAWFDEANGEYYLFGGLNIIPNLFWADLWKLSLSSKTWTFLKGSSTANFGGSYGTFNTSSPDNLPSARYSCSSWFDPVARRLYMFGGNGPSGFLSDTWYFSLESMEFVWIGGPMTYNQPGSYGQKRVFSASNTPPARHGASDGFDPVSRKLLMFGGGLHPCNDRLFNNDLWVFDLELQQWAWWHGSDQFNQTGTYGQLGVEDSASTPGARIYSTGLLRKTANNETSFFLYGGLGYGNDSSVSGGLDDIWSFSMANSSWTWRSGRQAVSNSASNLGNTPGGQGHNGPGWVDPDMNGFFIFSGSVEGWCVNLKGRTDIWFYNWNTFSWQFIKGTNSTIAPPAVYGELGVPSNTSFPSERGGFVQWVDKARRALFLFSGGRTASMWSVRLPALPEPPTEPLQQGPPEFSPFVANETAPPTAAPSNLASADQMIAVRAAVGVIVALTLSTAIGIIAVVVIRKRNAKKRPGTADPEHSPAGTNYTDIATKMDQVPVLAGDTFKPEWMIPFSELTFKNKLGQGAFGIVYRGVWHSSDVAIKQSIVLCVDDALEDFKREVLLMLSLRPHPNCVQMYGICVDKTTVYAIMELCSGGSVLSLLKAGGMALDRKLKIIAGIAAGVRHLHKHGIVHRDLAARNILLGSDDVAKVSDFGMSRLLDKFERQGITNSDVGPVRWMAPESVGQRKYSLKSDVWSWANTVVEILTEKIPYPKMSTREVITAVSRRGMPPPLDQEKCPPWLLTLLRKCWSSSPDDRPSMKEISDVLAKNIT